MTNINNHNTGASCSCHAEFRPNGCFAGGFRNPGSHSDDQILDMRQPWAPLRRKPTAIDPHCASNETPFCSSLSNWEAERFGPQYIALQKCNRQINGGYTVDAVSTCAVLVIGAGGLGSPLLMYLAAGGIGILGIMDGDVVEVSNLHRQIIHDEENQGVNKAVSAKQRLSKINSQGVYLVYDRFFGEEEANKILPKYDIVVDATDNPQTRYLINDSCVKYNKILVIASSIGTQGQLMVFNRNSEDTKGPCYRCISPLDGNPFINVRRGACSFAGVLGPLPGIMGCLQATEVLKIAAGAVDVVLGQGHMLLYDTMNVQKPFRCIQLTRNIDCPTCGDDVDDVKLKMMPWQLCRMNNAVDDLSISTETFRKAYMDNIKNGTPVKVKLLVKHNKTEVHADGEEYTLYLFDVRPREHYSLCHLTGATNWPVSHILDDLSILTDHTVANPNVLNPIDDLLQKKCQGLKDAAKVLLMFICFLGNSSRVSTDAVRKAIDEHGSTEDSLRIKCVSIAGGYRAIRTQLGIDIPLS
ncbi:ubiquitin-activating enzyme like protein [Babesia gibsoni]|uniref:Ubiquitin-activating enzyme like protein n=1 Tax=Babesia gibsoni TaxID=33632 RepID=A0AAD8P846_BABGI|nr:ubiquitin-activating enzyme like protein [Babesia gibsoni]